MDALPHIIHTASVSTEFHGDNGSAWNVRTTLHLQELLSLMPLVATILYQDERNPEPKQVFVGLVNG
jgi:hypothetical protein